MDSFLALFEYQYFINALLAAAMTAVACGIAGTYIVARRMVFISGGITHASFGGVGIAWYIGIQPLLGAAVFAILSGLGFEALTQKGNIRNDSVIAMLWSLGMATGVIFIYLSPGYAPNLMSYLFGNILTVNMTDLICLAILNVVLIAFFMLFYRRILYISYDQEYSRSQNMKTAFFNYALIALISLTIVLSIKIAGIILLLSLLTIPQNAANLFTKNFKKIIYLSIIIGFGGSITGLILSWYLNIPSGATIIFSLVLIYLLLYLVRPFRLIFNR